jgi:hypothetical protein
MFDYRFGVIDFLTRHSAFKTLETEFKSVINWVDKSTISAQRPDIYQQRFL